MVSLTYPTESIVTRFVVDQQVLTPLDERSIMLTPTDQDSIMCYQLPGSITIDGRPIRGGLDINPTDYAFAGRIYPKPASSQRAAERQRDHRQRAERSLQVDDWNESEDVEVDEEFMG